MGIGFYCCKSVGFGNFCLCNCRVCFGKIFFRGKAFLIGAALIIILIPRQALVVPIFEWFNLLGWVGNSWSLILCGIASGLGVCFFAQSFKHLPDELMEISKLQGLSPVKIFILILPLFTPGMVTYFLLHFALCWQEHLLALLLLVMIPNSSTDTGEIERFQSSCTGSDRYGRSYSLIYPNRGSFALFLRKMKTALSQLSLSWILWPPFGSNHRTEVQSIEIPVFRASNNFVVVCLQVMERSWDWRKYICESPWYSVRIISKLLALHSLSIWIFQAEYQESDLFFQSG